MLDSDLRKEYIQTQQYPNTAKIDNMTVMLKVINKDMSVMQYISILIENAVGSLKAMYTMARKKFKTTNDLYYAKIMISSFKAFNSIIDGTMTSENAVKKFLIDLFS